MKPIFYTTILIFFTLCGMSVVKAQPCDNSVQISEVRIDQPGSDNDEFFELVGTPNGSLDNLFYIVIGDGGSGSGQVEAVIDLSGNNLDANGFFVVAEGTFTLGTANLTTNLNFENGDNVTHLLVCNFSGANGDDLDTDDDGTLDSTPWSEVVDGFSLFRSNDFSEQIYAAAFGLPVLGPDGGQFTPGHVYLTSSGEWVIGSFPLVGQETPGSLPSADCRNLVSVPMSSTMATAANTCLNADGYIYYDDPNQSGNNYFFAINWDPTNIGGGHNLAAQTNALVKITVDPTFFSAENIPGAKATYTMARYWDVDLQGNSLDGPVNVRFFYELNERDEIIDAASLFASTNSTVDEGFTWFKRFDDAFDPNTQVFPAGVDFGLELLDMNTGGLRQNGQLYTQFESITFSGGTGVAGAGTTNQLNLTWISFEGQSLKTGNQLSWEAIVDESDTEFLIERANSTGRFEAIGSVSAQADLEKVSYSFLDQNAPSGLSLYRLHWIDQAGESFYSEVIALKRDIIGTSILPNPVYNQANLFSSNLQGDVQIQVFHTSGKQVRQIQTTGEQLENGFLVPLEDLPAGAYYFRINDTEAIPFIKH